jgi:hypothetical protein
MDTRSARFVEVLVSSAWIIAFVMVLSISTLFGLFGVVLVLRTAVMMAEKAHTSVTELTKKQMALYRRLRDLEVRVARLEDKDNDRPAA